MPNLLVVGAQGQIGSRMAEALPGKGWSVATTTRRGDHSPTDLRLDLSDSPAAWPVLPQADAAIICAGVTSQQACEAEPAEAWAVNVEHTIALARMLSEEGAFVLVLSSVGVFDGAQPKSGRDREPTPLNEYGRQKAAAEAAILARGNTAILRLSKVIGPDMPLLKEWSTQLSHAAPIRAFNDVTLAPVTVDFVTELAHRILRSRRPGIYHASGDRDLNYTDLANMLCDTVHAPATLIQAESAGGRAAAGHTTLDMSLEHELFGVMQPSSEAAIRETLLRFAAHRTPPAES